MLQVREGVGCCGRTRGHAGAHLRALTAPDGRGNACSTGGFPLHWRAATNSLAKFTHSNSISPALPSVFPRSPSLINFSFILSPITSPGSLPQI